MLADVRDVVSTLITAFVGIALGVLVWHLLLQQRVKRGEVTAADARASTRRFAVIFVPLAVLVIVLANIVGH